MKVSILVIFIVLPMLASIGLYTFSFISKQWSYIDNNSIGKYSSKTKERVSSKSNNSIQFESQIIRHAFRSYYGLFGYCLDYQWRDLLTIKSETSPTDNPQSTRKLFCDQCDQPKDMCSGSTCCVS
jgi:hypothetical protein